jgi:hypothetical protein
VAALTHRQACKDIFTVTCVKTLAVLVVIDLVHAYGLT